MRRPAVLTVDYPNAFRLDVFRSQGGTAKNDVFNVATVGADDAVLLSGYTKGSWDIADSNGFLDFAAVLLDTRAAAPTPPPTTLEPAPTPPPTVLEQSVSPTSLESTASPTALESPTTPRPTAQEPATTTPSVVQSSAPSSTRVLPSTSTSASSAGRNQFIAGAVGGAVVTLALIGVFVFRRSKCRETVSSTAPAEDGNAHYPQAVTPPPANYPQALTPPSANYPQAVTP